MRGALLVVAMVGARVAAASPPPDLDPTPLAAKVQADLLWPLARTPEMRPRVPLLAWYGEEWPALCADKAIAGTPGDIVAYVHAWCARTDEVADALFAQLADSSATMKTAIRADLIDVVAATDSPSGGLAWFDARHLLTYDLHEAFVATELATGKLEHTPVVGMKEFTRDRDCHMLAWSWRGGDNSGGGMLTMLASEGGYETCKRLYVEMNCPLATGARDARWRDEDGLALASRNELVACMAFDTDHRHLPLAKLFATVLVARWPATDDPAWRWLAVADVAAHYDAWGPELEDVATAALDGALTSTSCNAIDADNARQLARQLRGKPDRRGDAARDARLDAIIAGACR